MVYLGLSWAILVYHGLSQAISGYLEISLAISCCLGLYRPISVYFGVSLGYIRLNMLSWAISGYLWLSWAISGHLGRFMSSIKYQGARGCRREKVIAIQTFPFFFFINFSLLFFFITDTSYRGACAPKNRIWNYCHVTWHPVIFVSLSLTFNEVGHN